MDNNRPYPELESLKDEICGNQCHCFECIRVPTAGSTQTTAADLEESEPEDPPPVVDTRRKRDALQGEELAPKVLHILDAIKEEEGMTLSIFLDALSWGDEECHSND